MSVVSVRDGMVVVTCVSVASCESAWLRGGSSRVRRFRPGWHGRGGPACRLFLSEMAWWWGLARRPLRASPPDGMVVMASVSTVSFPRQ